MRKNKITKVKKQKKQEKKEKQKKEKTKTKKKKTTPEKHPQNQSKIIPKSFPKKDYNLPNLQVKIGINDSIIIIIISCAAVQLFQEFIILSKG